MQVNAGFLNGLATCSGNCFTITESTLSAHAYNFYVGNLSTGTHTVHVEWSMVGGTSGEGACVGPGTVTVEQVKGFSFDTPLAF
jgi:hypothetical protein